MKRYIGNILTLLVITVGCTVGTAVAASGTIAKVSIPFEFSVGNRTYPAGNYSLEEIRQHVIAIYDGEGRNVGMVLAYDVRPTLENATGSELKFEVVDGRRMLAEVWTEGEQTGLALPLKRIAPTQQASSTTLKGDGGTALSN